MKRLRRGSNPRSSGSTRSSFQTGALEARSSLALNQSFLSSWWRPILGTLLVLAGLATAILTLMARRLGAPELTSTGAIASLLFVLLIMILVVPPLTRSALAEGAT